MKNNTTPPAHHQTAATPLLESEGVKSTVVQVHLLAALGELTQLREAMCQRTAVLDELRQKSNPPPEAVTEQLATTQRHDRECDRHLTLLQTLLDNVSRLMSTPRSQTSDAKLTLLDLLKMPDLNTWWVRECNQKRYCLRQIQKIRGLPYVWLYEEGVNRCHRLPLTTLLNRYHQLGVSPVYPAADNNRFHLN